MDYTLIDHLLEPAVIICNDGLIVYSNQHRKQNIPFKAKLTKGANLLDLLRNTHIDPREVRRFLKQEPNERQNIIRIGPRCYHNLLENNFWIKVSRLNNDKHFIAEFEPNLTLASTYSFSQHMLLLNEVINSSPVLMSFIDCSYRYQMVNSTYLSAHARTRQQVINTPVPEILGSKQFSEEIKPRLDKALSGLRISYSAWFYFEGLNENRFCRICYAPSTDQNNTILGVLVTVQDQTELKQEAVNYKAKMTTDALTELENRHSFNEHIKATIDTAHKCKDKFTLLFIDLDNYKTVNDNYGHQTGDQVLKQVADRLQLIVRSTDHLARWGGDEFVAILSSTKSTIDIITLINRIHNILLAPFIVGELRLNISCSIGAALFPDHGSSIESLLNYADHMMYLDKNPTT